MIAGGMDPAELARLWEDADRAAVMHPRAPWRPWRGIFDPAALEELARRLAEDFRPCIPFALTLVEVPRVRRVMVPGQQVTWRHLLATCSFPLGYPPVRIGGKLYVDGGLLGALPLWAAGQMGASRALAIDAMPRMPSRGMQAAVRTAQRLASREPAPPPEVRCLVPSRRLGGIREAFTWRAENAHGWLELGARDAERMLQSGSSASGGVFD
jgi:predicted acylesterase/phospholipase RssA